MERREGDERDRVRKEMREKGDIERERRVGEREESEMSKTGKRGREQNEKKGRERAQ